MFGDLEYDATCAYAASKVEDQYDALLDLQRQGKIREIALSNETPFGLMRFCETGSFTPWSNFFVPYSSM